MLYSIEIKKKVMFVEDKNNNNNTNTNNDDDENENESSCEKKELIVCKKYEVEDDINFFEELQCSLQNSTSSSQSIQKEDDQLEKEKEKEKEDNICLISHLPLTDYFIELQCGHKFNYGSLYNDLVHHKRKYNRKERQYLDCEQIRCPYCRQIHNHLLPYHDFLPYLPVHGVNYIDIKQYPPNYNTIVQNKLTAYINEFKEGECNFINQITGKKCCETNVLMEKTCNKEKKKDQDHQPSVSQSFCMYHIFPSYQQYTFSLCTKENEKAFEKEQKKRRLEKKKQKQLMKSIQYDVKKLSEVIIGDSNNDNNNNSYDDTVENDGQPNKKQKVEVTELQEVPLIDDTYQMVFHCKHFVKGGKRKGKPCALPVFDFETNECKRHRTQNFSFGVYYVDH